MNKMKKYTGRIKGTFEIIASSVDEVYDILEEIEDVDLDYIDIDEEDQEQDYPNEDQDRERYFEKKYANN